MTTKMHADIRSNPLYTFCLKPVFNCARYSGAAFMYNLGRRHLMRRKCIEYAC